MRFLIEFIGGKQNSKISSLIKCSENEAKILRHLSKSYVEGTPQSSAYDVLCAVFGSEEYKFLAGLADVKNLLESGWIVQGFSILKTLTQTARAQIYSVCITARSRSRRFFIKF